MKYIKGLIQRIFEYDLPKKPTGRWNLEYCDKKLNYKVGLSNEDNCGVCSQYALTKNNTNNTNKTNKLNKTNKINNTNDLPVKILYLPLIVPKQKQTLP
jgi:hypothetical protein